MGSLFSLECTVLECSSVLAIADLQHEAHYTLKQCTNKTILKICLTRQREIGNPTTGILDSSFFCWPLSAPVVHKINSSTEHSLYDFVTYSHFLFKSNDRI